jgi:hypothetical protein
LPQTGKSRWFEAFEVLQSTSRRILKQSRHSGWLGHANLPLPKKQVGAGVPVFRRVVANGIVHIK